ncbi:MAG TPA: tyrosine--tRNA ligase [Candidatus Limnocylindrales bacterium]|nr:tyrosine--tRNA ligase [Candidatus Limnocylindrales bacterium]
MTSFDPGPAGLLEELRWRGMLHAASEGLEARLATGRPISGYNGFDPSGPSLHIGSLVPIFGLLHFQRHGGRPVALVGGGTGMIGDPSGRSSERNLLDVETLEFNVASIRAQLEHFLDFDGPRGAVMVNNLDWLGSMGLIEFLRDVGKHFTVPYMLAKDSVQTRLERGLSFTEFSYMLLQSADFAHLHRTMGVEMQMGGADQWGNITAGLELIRRTSSTGSGGEASAEPAFALAYPLLLTPSGAKFGKSEGGDSVWLDPAMTTPFAFYQHWLNTDDRDVGVYLRWFTTMSPDEIEGLDAEVAARPGARAAQRALALDVTGRTHGTDVARQVEADSVALFAPEPIRDPALLERLFASVGGFEVDAAQSGAGAAAALAGAGVFSSNGEARRMIQNGGLTINGEQLRDPAAPLPEPIAGEWWEVRIGKRRREIGRLGR